MKFLKGGGRLPGEIYQNIYERAYIQADTYVGQYLPLLDRGWTIVMVSDHGLVCPEHHHLLMGDNTGINTGIMRELGFTVLKNGENGELLHEIDWEKTKAVAQRGNHIYINLKGRDKWGIVEPADQYEMEEEIITALYGYKDKSTGHRVIALALRNKDAILLGMGGPEAGDIIYWMSEGYNYDHGDSLSTTLGMANTSVSPLFIAAGQGIKQGYFTERGIREVDVAPTVAVLGGVRMPAQCEGAPVYQIFEENI